MKMKLAVFTAGLLVWCRFGEVAAQDASDFERWQQEELAELEDYLSKEDQEFLSFLKKEWIAAELSAGVVQDQVPKPPRVPVAPSPPQRKQASTDGEKVGSAPPTTTPALPKPVPVRTGPTGQPLGQAVAPKSAPAQPVVPDQPAPPPLTRPVKRKPSESLQAPERMPWSGTVAVQFFGEEVTLSYDEKMGLTSGGQATKEFIGAYWEAMSRTDYQALTTQLRDHKKRLNLNDWGYCLFLYEAGKSISKGDRNCGVLFAWYMLSKSGYEVKVGYSGSQIALMITADTPLYGVLFLEMAGTKYYAVRLEADREALTSLSTYDGVYAGSDKKVSFRLPSPPRLGQTEVGRTYRFGYDGQEYQVPVKLKQESVDFLRRYPQASLQVYFAAPPSPETGRSLVEGLRPLVTGKPETEAVNILLRFVQTALNYQIDEEQFGREKSLFLEETLFYPYSDCEDRSILFSYLVRNLLQLEVIGLSYPGHVATAVRFSSEVEERDFVRYNQKRYAVCDPTYVNASWGMAIPQFKSIVPKIIATVE
ncbi:MAG: hypothetical protein FJY95_23165 [Candidatus Handelsmanbacteria bacterium]|nr:hypothetical protein [Candidatus Handelsmanbacteria bacterium]